MISINHDLESTYISMEKNLEKADQVILGYEKELIYRVVIEKFSKQFINRQRRINSIKSPFIRAREILQEVLGENMEAIRIEEVIDLSPLEKEKELAWEIISNLSYIECVTYFDNTKKHGLKKANKMWKAKKEPV